MDLVLYRVIGHSFFFSSGTRAQDDPLVAQMLRSGIESPPSRDVNDRHSRAAG